LFGRIILTCASQHSALTSALSATHYFALEQPGDNQSARLSPETRALRHPIEIVVAQGGVIRGVCRQENSATSNLIVGDLRWVPNDIRCGAESAE